MTRNCGLFPRGFRAFRGLISAFLGFFNVNFSRNNIAFKTVGTNLQRERRTFNFRFNFLQIWLPCPPCMILGVTNLVTGNGSLSTNIAHA
jgi:hypothetical protein